MKELIRVIGELRAKLESLRRHELKETPTRTIVIDPLLEALGWDVRDPDEVQLEYPTVDGKSVDYALKLNRKPSLLVEAKALDDSLSNVKDITQVVGYAANDGIAWCILTNGIIWKVYHSIEKAQAPDKLMYEVCLDPKASDGLTVEQLAEKMWRFSREEMAKGTLDAMGERVFTDGKVRKALASLFRDPPRPLLNIVRKAMTDQSISPQKIKESLARVWPSGTESESTSPEPNVRVVSPRKLRQPGRGKAAHQEYTEERHVAGKPQEVLGLYAEIERICLSLSPGGVTKKCLAKTVNYTIDGRCFCAVHLLSSGLRVWLWLDYQRLSSPPAFARDVARIGHWGGGDLELGITQMPQLRDSEGLIRQSYEARIRQ